MEYLLVMTSVFVSSARGILSKRLSSISSTAAGFGRVNASMSFCALIVVTVYAMFTGLTDISVITIVSALLYALFTIAAQLFYMLALAAGEVSAVTFFYSCGFVIPTFAGTFIFSEELTIARLVGVALLVGALCLNSIKPNEKRSAGNRWIIYSILAMISSGLIGLIQKLHQSSPASAELGVFLIIAFAVCTLISLLLACTGQSEGPETLPSLSCGICIGTANIINTQLSGMIPALILFPALNGGVVIVSTIASRVIFGERIGVRRLLAMLIGMLAIVLLTI